MSIFTDSTHKVVTRFAPSPTGFMHVGGARTGLFAYLFAKKNKGTFILRIEDTDKERQVEGSIEHIMEALAWLNIEWDFGPDRPGTFGSCIQSERLHVYKKYADQLVKKGFAYPDPYTEEELGELREKAEAERRPFLFREHRKDSYPEWDGKSTLRFRVPTIERKTWHDEVRGTMTAGEEALDDFVLMKADGYPTYNLAHIVDDYEMGVTHIMRADEFISSTPKFLSLYEALGFPIPQFITLPPIMRSDRTKKLGKRDGAKDLLEYREEGYLPTAMVNFLALTGWNPGTDVELFTHEELINAFSISGIQTGGALLNEEKLLWLNREHILRMNEAYFKDYVDTWLPDTCRSFPQFSPDRLTRLLPVIRERISKGSDLLVQTNEGEYDFAFKAPTVPAELLKWKGDSHHKESLPRLQKLAEIIARIPEDVDANLVKEYIWDYAEEVGRGQVLWPLRVALTGKEKSPDPFTIISIIGSAEAYNRVKNACDTILRAV